MMLQSLYALIDLGFVGRLGEDAVAGLAISLQVFFIILALGQVIATTALANISQAYGAGDLDRARSLFSGYFIVGASVGVVAAITAYTFAPQYVSAFTGRRRGAEQGLIYFRINCVTFFSQLLLIVFALRCAAAETSSHR